ncbi:hypothetical protein BGX31_000246 [Mortierella sp. GBA43]|nr:hypothetical protein BGX31_000246 [Mortierella sp. GBA43]
MGINANILPVFDQLDMIKDLEKIAFPCTTLELYKESLKKIGAIDLSGFKEKAGYYTYIFHRPDFYELLLARIPREKMSFNKKVVWVLQNKEGVMIRTSDNETYHGDILVGADGAYSAVRQNIFKDLAKKGSLPASDSEGFKMGFVCMVGTTKALDPEEYPELKDDRCHFITHIGKDKSHTWVTTTLPNNRISFIIAEQLDEQVAKDQAFRNSEWSSESNAATIKQVRDFAIKHGREGGERKTLGHLIDMTDPGLISKVFLEEKLFETWYHGRTVLIGDACHKMQPSAGQGAVNAMEDAVILANCLYDISGGKEPVTPDTITAAFKDYKQQRYPHAKYQVENSQEMAKLLNGQKLGERLVRSIVYNLPRWIMNHAYLKQAGYRPQVMFLPTIPNPKGLPVVPQKPSKRYLEELAERQSTNGSDFYLELSTY